MAAAPQIPEDLIGLGFPVQQAELLTQLFKLTPSVNVSDYGATGNGVTNDTVAIREASEAAQSLGLPLFFPAGTYAYAGLIVAGTDPLGWVCVPGSAVLKRIGTGGGSQTIAISASKFTCTGLTFDFNKAAVVANQWGVFLNSVGQNVAFTRCKFKDNGGALGSGVAFLNTLAANDPTGQMLIDDCEFSGFTWNAIYVGSRSNVIVRGCRVHDNSGTAIDAAAYLGGSLTNFSSDVLIVDNSVYNNAVGIQIGGFGPPYDFTVPPCKRAIVTDNRLWDNGTMLGLQGHEIECSENQIFRVDAVADIGAAMFVNAMYVNVTNNRIVLSDADWGIDFGGSTGVQVAGNIIRMTSGILINAGGTADCTVRDNQVVADSSGGGNAYCCYILDFESDGSGRDFPTQCTNLLVEDNQFLMIGNGSRGVTVRDNAGGGSGKIPLSILQNAFVLSSGANGTFCTDVVGNTQIVQRNTKNGTVKQFLNPNGGLDLVFDQVTDEIVTFAGSGATVEIRSVVSGFTSANGPGESILWVNAANPGSGYTEATTLSANGSTGGSGWVGSPVISNGGIIGVRTTSRGSGYTGTLTISATDSGGGSGATFTVVNLPGQLVKMLTVLSSSDLNVVRRSGGYVSISGDPMVLGKGGNFTLSKESNTAWRLDALELARLNVADVPAATAAMAKAKAWIEDSATKKFLAMCDGTGWYFSDGTVVS